MRRRRSAICAGATPKPAPTWEGVRKADQFGATCMQTPYPEGSPYRAAPEPVSEDCLYLNIWTGAKSIEGATAGDGLDSRRRADARVGLARRFTMAKNWPKKAWCW